MNKPRFQKKINVFSVISHFSHLITKPIRSHRQTCGQTRATSWLRNINCWRCCPTRNGTPATSSVLSDHHILRDSTERFWLRYFVQIIKKEAARKLGVLRVTRLQSWIYRCRISQSSAQCEKKTVETLTI